MAEPKAGAALEGAAHSWALPAGGAVCFPGTQTASSCLIGNLNRDFLLEKKKKRLFCPQIFLKHLLCACPEVSVAWWRWRWGLGVVTCHLLEELGMTPKILP